jgi:chromosome segregation ATPase
MSETFNFSSGKNRKIDRVIEGLQQANEVASDLESITGEFRAARENIEAIGAEVETIKTEINDKEDEKKDTEDQSREDSQSPNITRNDLLNPNN